MTEGMTIGSLMEKLPEQEREPMAELANAAAGDKEKEVELKQKLASWLNKDEIQKLFKKVSDRLFKEFLQEAYKDADGEQKKKLKEMFRPVTFEE